MKPTKLFLALAAIATISLGARATADTAAFTATGSSPTAGYGLNALVFTVNAPITVDELGFFAYSINIPAGDKPQVDLYSVATAGTTTVATELATTGIISSNINDDTFTYSAITPLTLDPGTYMVAAGLYWSSNFSGVTYASGINSPLVAGGGGWGGSFDPNSYATASVGSGVGSVHDFTLGSGTANGVNFEFNPAEINVPEPSAWALMSAGLVALGALLLVRHRSARS